MEIDNLKLELAFRNVYLILKENKNVNGNSIKYAEYVKEYCEDTIKSFNFILNPELKQAYHISPHVLEIVKLKGKEDLETIGELKTEFSLVKKCLDNLIKGKENFKEDKLKATNFLYNLSNIFE